MMFYLDTFLAEAEESSSGVDLLLPATSELVAGVVAFGVVFFFVWKWALPALNETLDTRAEAIEGQISKAKNEKYEAQKTREDYQKLVANADEEVKKIIDEGKATAEKLKEGILNEAKEEAEAIIEKARADSEAERDRISSEIKSEVADLSLEISEKVASSMSKADQEKLINEFIKEMGSDK
jgi:F-type H+-transporting ATPase subunit b